MTKQRCAVVYAVKHKSGGPDALKLIMRTACRDITKARCLITSTVCNFSIRTGHRREEGVIYCAGSLIVAGGARGRSGRFGPRRPTLTVHQFASKARRR